MASLIFFFSFCSHFYHFKQGKESSGGHDQICQRFLFVVMGLDGGDVSGV